MRIKAFLSDVAMRASSVLETVAASTTVLLNSDQRCGICGSTFQDDLPCRLCSDCRARLPLWSGHVCELCEKPLAPVGPADAQDTAFHGLHCSDCCRRTTYIDGAVYIGLYKGCLREAIHSLKYRGFVHLGTALGSLLGESFVARHGLWFRGIVVPIPLHPRRLAERGFNQAESIARGLSRVLGARLVTGVLEKVQDTADQKRLSGRLRATNILGAFSATAAAAMAGKDIALVDDVMTTGSTVNEAAGVLKRCGASRVLAAVAASGLGQPCDCQAARGYRSPELNRLYDASGCSRV